MTISTLSNRWLEEKCKKNVNEETDTFRIILLDTTFTFDRDTHETEADIQSHELATGNGYTQGGQTLSGGALTRDDTDDEMNRDWSDVTWTASGGNLGPTRWCAIIDDTHANNIIMGCSDFEQDITVADGQDLVIQDILKQTRTNNSP